MAYSQLRQGRAGDIITERKYHDFELSIDFKFSEGANSGIKYFIGANGSVGCEYQILDDEVHPDANRGFEGNRRLGSLYDILAFIYTLDWWNGSTCIYPFNCKITR